MNSPIKYWRSIQNWNKYLGKKGKIISATRIESGPAGFEKQSPYWVGIIELENKEKVTGAVKLNAKCLKPKAGQKVVGILRRTKDAGEQDIVEYGVKWKVVSSI